MPGAAASMALPIEQGALGRGLTQGVFEAFSPIDFKGFEQSTGRRQQILLLQAKKLLAAFTDEQKAELAFGITTQVEQHAWQIGGQCIKTRLALVEHFQRRTVVGTMPGFPYFAFDSRNQTFQPVRVDHVARSRFHRPLRAALVIGPGDNNQRQVKA